MARARMTQRKRQREVERRERSEEKAVRRAERKANEPNEVGDGEDPQLAGIVAGPQPPRED
jgi:hypothetical protein